jgi:uracil-DNA glycosylase family 4
MNVELAVSTPDNAELNSAAWTVEELRARLAACRQCAAEGFFIVGPPLVRCGPLPAPIFVLGQAPAAVYAGNPAIRPFSPGRHGQPSPLWAWLEQGGWEEERFRATAYMAAITRCYPGPAPSGAGDRRPSAREQAMCRPFWQRELVLVQPEIIVTLGTMALHALGFKGLRLREAVGQVYHIQLAYQTVPVLPLPHPSGVSRWLNDPVHRSLLDAALAQLDTLTQHLRGDANEESHAP